MGLYELYFYLIKIGSIDPNILTHLFPVHPFSNL